MRDRGNKMASWDSTRGEIGTPCEGPGHRPGSKSFKRAVSIRAVVRDNVSDLEKGDIRLFVDGKRKKGFSYDRSTDRLVFTARDLFAIDGAGNVASRSWSFTVKKR